VPIHITLDANLHGMDVFARQMPETIDGDVLLMLSASRAAAVVGYAVFIMFAMVLITIIVASIVVVFTVQKRKIEFSAFGWIGGLIFALPAVRNSMPGIPALGVLSDFLVFFWALGAVVVSYIFLVRIWIKRPA
jgi:hypothetical protein